MQTRWRKGVAFAVLAVSLFAATNVTAQIYAAVGRPMNGFGITIVPPAMALSARMEAAAAASASARTCYVADPNDTPLNVRATPRGAVILATLNDGVEVRVLDTATADNGKLWARIETAPSSGIHLAGWVFLDYLYC